LVPAPVDLHPLAGPDTPAPAPPDRAVAAAVRGEAPPDASLNGHPLDLPALAAAVSAAGGLDGLDGDGDAWAAYVLPRVGGVGAASRQPGADGDAVRRAYERWVVPVAGELRATRKRGRVV
jgi:hypothetical protein